MEGRKLECVTLWVPMFYVIFFFMCFGRIFIWVPVGFQKSPLDSYAMAMGISLGILEDFHDVS